MIIFGTGVLLITVTVIIYHFSFPVKEDCSNLTECINDFSNRGYSIAYSNDIRLYDSVVLGKKQYTLIELNGQLGRVVLVHGMTGRYRIDELSYGSGNFRVEIVDSNGKKHLLLGGRNTSLELSNIAFTLEDQNYRMDIPSEKRFLVHTEVDSRIQLTHIDLDSLQFCNAQGEDITEQVDWNGVDPKYE